MGVNGLLLDALNGFLESVVPLGGVEILSILNLIMWIQRRRFITLFGHGVKNAEKLNWLSAKFYVSHAILLRRLVKCQKHLSMVLALNTHEVVDALLVSNGRVQKIRGIVEGDSSQAPVSQRQRTPV